MVPRVSAAGQRVKWGYFGKYLGSLCKIEHFPCADCRIMDSHEGQDAYSQRGTSCLLPDLRRGAGRQMRTHHGTPPYTAAP